jgi:hypothetical protein
VRGAGGGEGVTPVGFSVQVLQGGGGVSGVCGGERWCEAIAMELVIDPQTATWGAGCDSGQV